MKPIMHKQLFWKPTLIKTTVSTVSSNEPAEKDEKNWKAYDVATPALCNVILIFLRLSLLSPFSVVSPLLTHKVHSSS